MIRAALLERLFSRIKKTRTGCWEWTGASVKGYGVIRVGGRKGKNILVHRLMWELGNGRSIPKDKEPHHRCENPPCVRPSHLTIMTHRDHVFVSDTVAGVNARKEVCKRGHPFTVENTLLYMRIRNGLKLPERICRKCRKLTNNRWKRAQ